MTTGEKISRLRKECNYTQEQFANLMEVSRQSVSKWEQNLAYPETEKLIRMCALFQCSIDYLLREEVEHKNGIGDLPSRSINASDLHEDWEVQKKSSDLPIKTRPEAFGNRKPMLEACDVAKHYVVDSKIQTALQRVNVSFYRGEFVAVTGESGSGKTTFMNLISGAISYDHGELFYQGKKYSEFSGDEWTSFITEEIGYVAQDNKLLMHYTVEQNILSALLVKGLPLEQCYSRVRKILKTVGLSKFAGQKIIKLSAGQRQRVAIARMLAKDASIILADEATANLDEETAKSILAVLKKISKDKLVILITHNYPQASEYVTRHIEIKNRTVFVDELLSENIQTNLKLEVESDQSGDSEEGEARKKNGKTVKTSASDKKKKAGSESLASRLQTSRLQTSVFVKWNIFSRPGMSVLMILLLLLSGLLIFAMGDLYFVNADEISIKQFDYSAFQNDSDKRIVVRRTDGGEITQEDIKRIQALPHVTETERYDVLNDVTYLYRPEEDFIYKYMLSGNAIIRQGEGFQQFMRSASGLSKYEIVQGRLPEKRGEVVVSQDDADLLGSRIKVFFSVPEVGKDAFAGRMVEVVGVHNRKQHQMYFDAYECDMFAALCTTDRCDLHFEYDERIQAYKEKTRMVPLIGQEEEHIAPGTMHVYETYAYMVQKGSPTGNCQIRKTCHNRFGLEETYLKSMDIKSVLCYFGEKYDRNLYNCYEDDPNVAYSHYPYVYVGEDTFHELYESGSKQMTAFIEDYLYCDQAMKEIEKLGLYECYSSYRISMNAVDPEKKEARTKLYGLLALSLLVLFLVLCFLISTIWNFRRKDFEVYKHLGIRKKEMHGIVYRQQTVYFAIGYGMLVIFTALVKLIDPAPVHDFMKYFRIIPFVVCSILFAIVALIAAKVSVLRLDAKLEGGK